MALLFVVSIWLLSAIAAALIARSRARSGLAWLALGAFLGPLALVVAAMPRPYPAPSDFDDEQPADVGTIGAPVEPPASAVDGAFQAWLREQGIDPQTLSAEQHAQLRAAFEQSEFWTPGPGGQSGPA